MAAAYSWSGNRCRRESPARTPSADRQCRCGDTPPRDRRHGAAQPRLEQAPETKQPVKKPDRASAVDPRLVAPSEREPVVDVVPAANKDEDGEDDVGGEKEFVECAADVEAAAQDEDHQGHGGDGAPDPVLLFCFRGVVQREGEKSVEEGEEGSDARDPSMEKEEG